jgi:predicted phosphoadenosine phosphosulfate sulfurtransferase
MKNYLKINVLQATQERIKYIFDNFNKIYVSFSGGKDSTVMLHLIMDEAIKRNQKIGLLFIDLEGQYKYTIDHINEMIKLYNNHIELYWICLPLILRNAVSVFEPRWICWDNDKRDIWIRSLPDNVIHDITYFSFFRKGMEFEDFVIEFGKWYSQGKKTACFVGIRSDESLNRFRTIKNDKKQTYNNKMWTTKIYDTNIYNIYPIYDWKTSDIWKYNGKYKKCYNKLYDIMYKAGLSIHQQRICQPYGDDQRKGLWLFHIIEPETWSKIIARVNGANSGAEFVQYSGNISGQIKITKPENHTWQSFSLLLLETMPEQLKEHYKNKIHIFLRWYEERGYRNGIPDEVDLKEESTRKRPSWRRIAKMLLRNDYWAKGLSFNQTKDGYFYKRYLTRIKLDRDKREFENKIKCRNGGKFLI